MGKMNENRKMINNASNDSNNNNNCKILAFKVSMFMGEDSPTLKETIKAIKYLRARCKVNVPDTVLVTLLYLLKSNSWSEDIILAYNREARYLGILSFELFQSSEFNKDIELSDPKRLKHLIRKNIPSYELGMNVDQPVFPIDLQDRDNVIVKKGYRTYIYRKEQRKFYDPISNVLVSELDMSTVVDVYRTEKVEKEVEFKTEKVWSKK